MEAEAENSSDSPHLFESKGNENDNEERNHNLDLPLSANFEEVFIHHYCLDLICDINIRKVFEGTATFFIEGLEVDDPSDCQAETTKFVVLDSFDLEVTDCWTFDLSEFEISTLRSNFSVVQQCPLKVSHSYMDSYIGCLKDRQSTNQKRSLPFSVDKHSIKIELPHLKSWSNVQTIVSIKYKTVPIGPCLMWTSDQDYRPCVFTIGDSLNNRSLFPCQDMPKAMATWHCKISLPPETSSEMTVLMTGEDKPAIHCNENNERTFECFNSFKMPMSTFALAIGCWSCSPFSFSCLTPSQNDQELQELQEMSHYPECRLFYPSALKGVCENLFVKYLPKCFDAITETLGPFPLKRLDFLVVPKCFDALGMASPNLIFLSQSLLCGDLSMFQRVSHEICHTWFGILTGPRDWTEEWLTEGICCYLEDIIHAKALGWTDQEEQDRNGLRTYQKYKLLTSEMDVTPDHLQLLRQEQGEPKSSADKIFVKDGINPEKSFMQIHYLKGFFLLRHLEKIAGKKALLQALKEFITQHLGLLFSSQELLEFLFTHCEHLTKSDLTVNSICHEWLDCPGLPRVLATCPVNMDENKLYQGVMQEFDNLKKSVSRKRPWKRLTSMSDEDTAEANDTDRQFLADQTVILIGKIMDDGARLHLTHSFLEKFKNSFINDDGNPEVLHEWCELVIQRQALKWRPDVKRFLLNHRAMGLYLYGELMISKELSFQALAYKCFNQCRTSMPRAVLTTLRSMLSVEGHPQ